MTAQVAVAIAVGIAAAAEDIMRRRISNFTCVAALICGLLCGAVEGSWRGVGMSALGAVAGFAVFLIFYVLGGMGGGDVKLMAGFGAILGVSRIPEAALWTAGLGGVMALMALGWTRIRRHPAKVRADAIPYAPAIALGAWLSLVPK